MKRSSQQDIIMHESVEELFPNEVGVPRTIDVSLLCTIRRILSSALSDVDKERLIESTFMNYSQLNIQECGELVSLAFNMILTDNTQGKKSSGWCILKSLEHLQLHILVDVIDASVIESLFTNYLNSPNVFEVPSLVNWCLKNGLTPALEQVVKENIVNFLRHAECSNTLADSNLLSSMAILMENHLSCIPVVTSQLAELCQAVIRKLATLEMPRDHFSVGLFISNICNVEKFLKIIADHTIDRRELSAIYLRILYATVSDSERYPDPSPALATILQVVDVDIISGSVQSILADHSDNESLVRLITMLCGWLVKWPRACNVNRWVLSLISKLEEEGRADILQAVAELNIDSLFKALLLPAMRPGVLPVVAQLLPTHCSSAEVFHRIIPLVPTVINQLRKEKNNPVSCDDLLAVLNITAQCMHEFPGYRHLYEPIARAHEACWQERGLSGSTATNSLSPVWKLSPPPSAARVGLHNLGNTCYMNSVLQALFMTHKFSTAVLQSDSSNRFQPVLCGLQKLFALLLHSRRPAISAEDFLNLTRPPGFSPGHQQDSSEFLIHVLDVLHEQEKNSHSRTFPEKDNKENEATSSSVGSSRESEAAGCGSATPMDEDDDEEDNMVGAVGGAPAQVIRDSDLLSCSPQGSEQLQRESETIVRRTFGGEWQMQIRCLRCESESSHTDPFIDLQVCFPEDHAGSDSQPLELQALIQALFSPEKLTGDNSYHCDKCRSLQEGVRMLRVVQPPEYLILILKHFQYNHITRQRTKLTPKVHYTETLEIPLASNMPNVARYRLYAAVVHSGRSVDAGHYYTFTRDAEDCWLRMDDETVTTSNAEQLNLLRPPETPYMLFYCGANGSLQPPVGSPDQLPLSTLRPGLAQFVQSDNAAYLQEERNRSRRVIQNKVLDRRYRPDDDDDDDENNHPGSSCGGQVAMNTPSNRFVY